MQTLPHVFASRTPSHFATGCGSRHRRLPVGGAPNGMPLKTRTPDGSVSPATSPASVLTGSEIAAGVVTVDAATPAAINTIAILALIRAYLVGTVFVSPTGRPRSAREELM